MKCKKCGHELQNDWKFCPVCSKKVNTEKGSFGVVIIVLVLILGYHLFSNLFMIGTPGAKQYLQKKYNEKFEVTLIKSEKNEDKNIGCDGVARTEKGKGNTETYLAYSIKEDLEFKVYYDTYKKAYHDTYKEDLFAKRSELKLREDTIQLYEKVRKELKAYEGIYYLLFQGGIKNDLIYNNERLIRLKPKRINSKEQLESMLINKYLTWYGPRILIIIENQDGNSTSNKFIKDEYNRLINISNLLQSFKQDHIVKYVDISIVVIDKTINSESFGVNINFDDNKVSIYSKNEQGIELEESLNEYMNKLKL